MTFLKRPPLKYLLSITEELLIFDDIGDNPNGDYFSNIRTKTLLKLRQCLPWDEGVRTLLTFADKGEEESKIVKILLA